MRFLYGVETPLKELNGTPPYDKDESLLIYEMNNKSLFGYAELDTIELIEISPI